MLDLNLILESLPKILASKCLILSVMICSVLGKLKRIKRTQYMYSTKSTIYICYHIEFLHIK